MVKVLIIENSSSVRALIEDILYSDSEIEIIGKTKNTNEAFEFLNEFHPDIIVMGHDISAQHGFNAAQNILETHPVPIIVMIDSMYLNRFEKISYDSQLGAVAIVEKPLGKADPNYQKIAANIIKTVKTMSQVKVVKRRTYTRRIESKNISVSESQNNIKCVVIGASTGGPQVLQTILSGLPSDFPVPILIVQHISKDFLQSMIDWLQNTINLPINIASEGQNILPGNIYFAPDDNHMGIDKKFKIILEKGDLNNLICPSVAYLFRSTTNVLGSEVIAVLLTGMGKDGARELKLLKEKGAITIVQNKETSAVFGMPSEAVKLGAAKYVLSPEDIVLYLNRLINV